MAKEVLIIVIVFAVIFLILGGLVFLSKITGRTTQAEELNCTDSDGRSGYYTKGVSVGKANFNSTTETYYDYCFNNTDSNISSCEGYGCSVYEYFCGFRELVNYVKALCPYGCKNGACISQVKNETEQNKTEQEEKIEEPIEEPTKKEISEEETKKPTSVTTSLTKKIISFFKKIFKI